MVEVGVRPLLYSRLLLWLLCEALFTTKNVAISVDQLENDTGSSHEMVEYGGEPYSLFKRPAVGSKIVRAALDDMVNYMDVHAIAKQLDQVGKFLNISINGLAMHSGLQGRVTALAIRVTRLGDRSALTIANFQQASGIVLDALESTYWYIYHGYEDTALEIFASVSSIASEMASKAKELNQLFDQEVKNVESILVATADTKEYEENAKVNLTLMINNFEARMKRAAAVRKEALTAFHNYERLFFEARNKEYDAIDDQNDPWKKIANGITSVVGSLVGQQGLQAYDFQALKSAEEAYRQEKLRYLDEMENQRRIKDQALAELEEFAHRVQNCHDDSQLADITIEALKETLGGLKIVANLMLDAARYWEAMHSQCDHVKGMGSTLAVQLMQKDVEVRRKLWQTPLFKMNALRFSASWVALGRVCEESMKGLKPVLQDLRYVIAQNPSREEALQNVRILAKVFKSELTKARRLVESEYQARKKDEL